MELLDIQHVAIRTDDLDATNKFYTEVLGMTLADRPDLPFPGSWLQMGGTQIHILAGNAGLDDDGGFTPGSNAVDHLALGAKGFAAYKQKFEDLGLAWRENGIPPFGIWQLFVKDPNGVTIELNFAETEEPAGTEGPDFCSGDPIRM